MSEKSTTRTRRVPPPPDIASAVGRLGASERWAGKTRAERRAGTEAARKAYDDRWLKVAREKYPDLDEAELARAAAHIRAAHYCRLQLASARARRARKAGGPDAT